MILFSLVCLESVYQLLVLLSGSFFIDVNKSL